MDAAAGHGHLAVVQWLEKVGMSPESPSRAMRNAVRGGHLAMVQWLHLTFGQHMEPNFIESVMYEALGYCHHDVARWLRSRIESDLK